MSTKKSVQKLIKKLEKENLTLICVTGKMASGKNYISFLLEQAGWKSIDADLLVHKAIENKEAKEKIILSFSEECKKRNLMLQNPDGTINRRELGKLLFEKPELLAVQEGIVYPVITKMIDDFIAENPKTIINATVLFKTKDLLKRCQAVVYVKSNFIKRILRSRKRDGLSWKLIIKRFHSQKNLFANYKKTLDPSQKLMVIHN